jgi:hypothetical protein
MVFFIHEYFLEIGVARVVEYDSIMLIVACEVKQYNKKGQCALAGC